MIDKIIFMLGSLPKEKRTKILRVIDIFTWSILILDVLFGLPRFWSHINLVICIIMLLLHTRILMMGGWWWANDEDEE